MDLLKIGRAEIYTLPPIGSRCGMACLSPMASLFLTGHLHGSWSTDTNAQWMILSIVRFPSPWVCPRVFHPREFWHETGYSDLHCICQSQLLRSGSEKNGGSQVPGKGTGMNARPGKRKSIPRHDRSGVAPVAVRRTQPGGRPSGTAPADRRHRLHARGGGPLRHLVPHGLVPRGRAEPGVRRPAGAVGQRGGQGRRERVDGIRQAVGRDARTRESFVPGRLGPWRDRPRPCRLVDTLPEEDFDEDQRPQPAFRHRDRHPERGRQRRDRDSRFPAGPPSFPRSPCPASPAWT
jgi:hypothetical protein